MKILVNVVDLFLFVSHNQGGKVFVISKITDEIFRDLIQCDC